MKRSKIRPTLGSWMLAFGFNVVMAILNVAFASRQYSLQHDFAFLMHCGFAALHLKFAFQFIWMVSFGVEESKGP
jgi:hypothetical protein